jgi:hypothetical protein
MANQDQALQVNLILLKLIRYYFSRISSQIFLFALSCSKEALAAEILIPVEDQSASYFLGPVGISDPSEFIAAESQRIPFKTSL